MWNQYNHNNNKDNDKELGIVCMINTTRIRIYNNVNETIIHVNQVKLVDRTQYFVRQKHVNFQLHLTHEYKDRLCS